MASQISSSASPTVPDLGFARAFGRIRRDADSVAASSSADKQAGGAALTTAEQRQLADLQKIDRRVRAHELAHINSGDGVVRGGATFNYAKGPDGRDYAIGGEVPIDTSEGRTPEQTLIKARAIEHAALAPVDPSTQDRRIAAQAAVMAADAQRELRASSVGGERESGGVRAAAFYQAVYEAGEPSAGIGFSTAV